MGKRRSLKEFLLLVLFVFFCTSQSTETSGYNGSVPESVRRPDQLKDPVYPLDLSIGELGPGEVSLSAYMYARRVLGEIYQTKNESALLAALSGKEREDLFAKITEVAPRKYRVGGGREVIDGSFSFLFRFIGREQELAGEIFLRAGEGDEEGALKLDGIIPEEPRNLSDVKDQDNPYPWTPYDRFF